VSEPYRILLVEECASDALLVEHELGKGGPGAVLTRAEDRAAYIEALRSSDWDLVVAAHVLPGFGADEALQILKEMHPDIPFIVVSSQVDELAIVPMLRAGAEHYISKNDMGRLSVAVERTVAAARRRRETADELRKHREHLEELVAERTAELETVNHRLELGIRERERIEDALRASEGQYRNLVESALDGICIIQDQKLVFVNQRLVEMLSFDSHEVNGTSFADYFVPEEVERAVGMYRRIIKGDVDTQRFEAALLTKRGRRIETGMNASAIDYHGRRAVMVVIRDISEQMRVRRMAIENERLEAVGIVARGVGNNFTNIMSVINSYAASIADSVLPHTRPHNAARKILDATRHAGDLTKRLLSVVRVSEKQTQANVKPVSLSDAIEKARGLVGHSLHARGVDIVIKKTGPLPFVMADQSQLLDTLMNIFLNGGDAMPEGGLLTLDVVERRIASPRSNPKAKGGPFVGLSIVDAGIGMSKEQVERVFEPFFTTKESQEAFGLGLPVAQSMAQSWGGWIDVRSRVGKGTRVRIFMAKAETPPDAAPEPRTGPMTVLVVEDHPERLVMMVRALEARGHHVLKASDGETAIRLHALHASEIDLSVIDWIMPGKDGKSVLQAVLGYDAQSKVIMLSGFSKDYVRSEIRMGAWDFLQKPFSAEAFAEAVEARVRKTP